VDPHAVRGDQPFGIPASVGSVNSGGANRLIEAANAVAPLLSALDPDRRATLVGVAEADGSLRFDIHLHGDEETVFLALR
jgi:hypothetical protein